MAATRFTGPIAIVVALAGVLAVGAGLTEETGLWEALAGDSTPPPREFPVLEPSRPIRIEIPSIGVEAPVHGVGLADDGSISVPSLHRHNEAGWYDRGPTRASSARRSSWGTPTPRTARRSSTRWPS
ncbi:hypothetical protein Psuf_009070 [Phytohabitans suffuscus]|uniref:Uncharacterized protein n=1 Tax=Phytohabitans suffuscus TaxID=624315 RepID=A0A6F8YBT6_9ACTN|nr:hypothetical protein [Phytohabitans suffuscus]BCB83594.1 hypothetical protein Psuf_009070 [Phytohabitans suffuscus]